MSSSRQRKRVFSGIQPSGDIHLGNYLGAMRRWAAEQDEKENIYFIANLEALTTKSNIPDLRLNTLKTLAWLLAVGLDPRRTIIFVSSQVPPHSELAWIFNNFVTMGELSRMTQFKDKSKRLGPEGQLVGLFDYPALMASDILLYDTDEVPVGEDQVQHVELTRDIAKRFNSQYGETFRIPKATIQKAGARVMDLQNPSKKMSKSDQDQGGVILMTESPDEMSQKIKRAVTDSGSEVRAADDKLAISNLLQIYSLVANVAIPELEKKYQGKGYADFKNDLAEAVITVVAPLQKRYQELMEDEQELLSILEVGATKAGAIAERKLTEVKQKLGLL
ncbi:tryptophan--tRNA ligase [Candidatus Microgenomates bacterium]|nr:tryptophan--tRNA ligase [Candidatus Microgenomates bacterium]